MIDVSLSRVGAMHILFFNYLGAHCECICCKCSRSCVQKCSLETCYANQLEATDFLRFSHFEDLRSVDSAASAAEVVLPKKVRMRVDASKTC